MVLYVLRFVLRFNNSMGAELDNVVVWLGTDVAGTPAVWTVLSLISTFLCQLALCNACSYDSTVN